MVSQEEIGLNTLSPNGYDNCINDDQSMCRRNIQTWALKLAKMYNKIILLESTITRNHRII